MEIIVQGKGENFYTPNQVLLNLNFCVKEKTYEEAFSKGSKEVLEFIDIVLLKNGLKKEDLKTNHFSIRKETQYNESTKTYDFIGYSYNQSAIVKFDYDKERLSAMIEAISEMTNPPFYHVDFTIKDVKECQNEVLVKAYKDAEEQAEMIAKAAGKILKRCVKTDFKPFTGEYLSRGYENDMVLMSAENNMTKKSIVETMNTVFTPEDVLISAVLYCLWIAE